jgi:hypothetical protein
MTIERDPGHRRSHWEPAGRGDGAGVTIRAATPSDARAIAQVHEQAHRETYVPLLGPDSRCAGAGHLVGRP